ncbi:hypothetical protein CIC12_12920 [Burkholderia sp. SG-MS1]|uniref:HAD domain-containing protein n=1 Tax=Paraburkholderia sp. SG-MS1 TaxID=2023741 RepID=UPI001446BF30|nr:HAD domain-containing protein [Paraburkholderia sp. SG-MS1]NKJ47628.1 hypothetical protein [Paraburkholderia sp. SG-MS1]
MNGNNGSICKLELGRQVLFLDFDGVLHRLSAIRTRRGITANSPSIQLFEFAPILADVLDPYGNVQIVLSTSWVPILGYQRARDALPTGLRARVVGATYHSQYADAGTWALRPRGEQILRYVWTNRLTNWLAIDDDINGLGQHLSHVVRCDERFGLGEVETQKVLRVRLAEQFR